MTTSTERKALNEATFREANDRLEHGARELLPPEDESLVPFLCECPRTNCTNVLLLTLVEYQDVRARSSLALAVPGHEDPEIERVVERNDRFVVTEKFGRAAELFTEADPRG